MDKLKIDNHKITYHISRLYQWYKGDNIYPIYIEIGLYGGCNQRCLFCSFDFLKYKPKALSMKVIRHFINQAAAKGVKSILYSGEGEPLLHKNVEEIIKFTKDKGIDVALSTNGVELNFEKAKNILPFLSWIRFSLNAGTKKGYALIHRAKESDFDVVVSNIEKAVKIRDRGAFKCAIGVQLLLITQNQNEVFRLVSTLKDCGLDYLVIKPYSAHPSSQKKFSFSLEDRKLSEIEKRVAGIKEKAIKVIFRQRSMAKLKQNKPYKRCLGTPFITHITASGEVYPCNNFIGNKDFVFGDISKQSFEEIWQGQRRKEIMKKIQKGWNVEKCRKACRIDEINRYLWELKHPGRHVNFI